MQRSLPRFELLYLGVPVANRGVSVHRETARFRIYQRRRNREITQCWATTHKIVTPFKMTVKNTGLAVEKLLSLLDLLRIRITTVDPFFDQVFPDQGKSGFTPVTHPPELPPANISPCTIIHGPETVARLLRGQVLHDGIGFPEDKVSIFQGGDLPIWVQAKEAAIKLSGVDLATFLARLKRPPKSVQLQLLDFST